MKIIQNLATLSNGKIGPSLLSLKPIEIEKLHGLKCAPKHLSQDTVEIGQKSKPHVSAETLQNLVNKNLSLQDLSDNLNMNISTVRFYLKKYNIQRYPEEILAVKKYFSTTDSKEKAKAYEVIDKHLQKIAKKEAEINKETSYDDCLQNARLRFLELGIRKAWNPSITTHKILDMVENTAPKTQPKIEKINYETIIDEIGVSDKATEMFEETDVVNYLFKNSNLNPREKAILYATQREEEPIMSIASHYELTPTRIKQIRNATLAKIKALHFGPNGDFVEPRKLPRPQKD